MTFDSSPFPVHSRPQSRVPFGQSFCGAGQNERGSGDESVPGHEIVFAGEGGEGIALGRWGSRYFCNVCAIHHIFACNLHDLCIEFSVCLERRLLKRRTTVELSDLAIRTYAGVEPINLSRT